MNQHEYENESSSNEDDHVVPDIPFLEENNVSSPLVKQIKKIVPVLSSDSESLNDDDYNKDNSSKEMSIKTKSVKKRSSRVINTNITSSKQASYVKEKTKSTQESIPSTSKAISQGYQYNKKILSTAKPVGQPKSLEDDSDDDNSDEESYYLKSPIQNNDEEQEETLDDISLLDNFISTPVSVTTLKQPKKSKTKKDEVKNIIRYFKLTQLNKAYVEDNSLSNFNTLIILDNDTEARFVEEEHLLLFRKERLDKKDYTLTSLLLTNKCRDELLFKLLAGESVSENKNYALLVDTIKKYSRFIINCKSSYNVYIVSTILKLINNVQFHYSYPCLSRQSKKHFKSTVLFQGETNNLDFEIVVVSNLLCDIKSKYSLFLQNKLFDKNNYMLDGSDKDLFDEFYSSEDENESLQIDDEIKEDEHNDESNLQSSEKKIPDKFINEKRIRSEIYDNILNVFTLDTYDIQTGLTSLETKIVQHILNKNLTETTCQYLCSELSSFKFIEESYNPLVLFSHVKSFIERFSFTSGVLLFCPITYVIKESTPIKINLDLLSQIFYLNSYVQIKEYTNYFSFLPLFIFTNKNFVQYDIKDIINFILTNIPCLFQPDNILNQLKTTFNSSLMCLYKKKGSRVVIPQKSVSSRVTMFTNYDENINKVNDLLPNLTTYHILNKYLKVDPQVVYMNNSFSFFENVKAKSGIYKQTILYNYDINKEFETKTSFNVLVKNNFETFINSLRNTAQTLKFILCVNFIKDLQNNIDHPVYQHRNILLEYFDKIFNLDTRSIKFIFPFEEIKKDFHLNLNMYNFNLQINPNLLQRVMISKTNEINSFKVFERHLITIINSFVKSRLLIMLDIIETTYPKFDKDLYYNEDYE